MKIVEAIIKPVKVSEVKKALNHIGIKEIEKRVLHHHEHQKKQAQYLIGTKYMVQKISQKKKTHQKNRQKHKPGIADNREIAGWKNRITIQEAEGSLSMKSEIFSKMTWLLGALMAGVYVLALAVCPHP